MGAPTNGNMLEENDAEQYTAPTETKVETPAVAPAVETQKEGS